MKKQFAVFGLGSFGESVAITLQGLGCEVIVVDDHMERIEEISKYVSYAMKADIEDPEVIRSLGARNLDGVVVAIADNMEASIMATLVSKDEGVPYVLAKAKNDLHAAVLRKIGADSVIFPEKEAGSRVARSLVSESFADWIALSSEYSVMEVALPESWVGKSLEELNVRKNHGVNVIGIRENDNVEVNAEPKKPLKRDMILILVGANSDLEKFAKYERNKQGYDNQHG